MSAILTANNIMSIDLWADLMGVPVLEFNNLDISACQFDYDHSGCSDFWTHWQYNANSHFSHEQLAFFIQSAEMQVEDYLGYHVAPKWTYEELHRINNVDIGLRQLKFQTNWKNIIAAGMPKQTNLGTAEINYSDEDGDGYNELCTMVYGVEHIDADHLNFPSRFRFYYPDHYGDDRYEIKNVLSVSYDSDTDNITATFNAWELVKPQLYLPKGFLRKQAFNACDDSIYIQGIEVGFEEVDTCKPNAELIWYGNKDICADDSCIEQRVPACVRFVDKCEGIFTVTPVTVDDDGCIDNTSPACQTCWYPDAVKINYLSGCYDSNYWNTAPLKYLEPCPELQRAILALSVVATGQLTCACGCIQEQIKYFNGDLSEYSSVAGGFRYPIDMLLNPFGSTKRGAIEAFRLLESIKGNSGKCYKRY